jgi:hypothetical protein
VHGRPQAIERSRHRAPQPPVGAGERRDPPHVDAVVVVLGQLVVEQEAREVERVLVGQLEDLRLGEEEVGQRHRRRVGREALLQRQLVAHPERADEHIDLSAAAGEIAPPALRPVHRVELDVGVVAEAREQRVGVLAPSAAIEDHVEVAVLAQEGLLLARRAVQRHPDAAEDPGDHAERGAGVDDRDRMAEGARPVGHGNSHPRVSW